MYERERERERTGAEEEMAAVTICVGDIHGYADRLQRLWANLERSVGAQAFSSATIIFLGDYNDRGPHTSAVLDFLIDLPRRHPLQKHIYLCGNHDFAFAAFLGCLPPAPLGFSFAATWGALRGGEEAEGWWSGEGEEGIHVQGRRWGGTMRVKHNVKKGFEYKGSTFDSATTFASYGVAHGDRQGLIKAVPENHKTFLQDLVWIYEDDNWDTEDAGVYHKKLIAVHAGLEKTKLLKEQLLVLRHRDVRVSRLEALSGRQNVWETPAVSTYSQCKRPAMVSTVANDRTTHCSNVSVQGQLILSWINRIFGSSEVATDFSNWKASGQGKKIKILCNYTSFKSGLE
ncbi:hypothetical protein O6H91_08G024000 [Diphasiastrum complanatum]|uniref:Uncharacterized protein n=1 Tax=Diphasiastrum complanatum TaxID=34168 RepID=A0ACC2CW04_DIPCM|nr:hypothetical protein O6H91_08G024000 [Diphasiastrum complanatum]